MCVDNSVDNNVDNSVYNSVDITNSKTALNDSTVIVKGVG